MKNIAIFLTLFILGLSSLLFSQNNLPIYLTEWERMMLETQDPGMTPDFTGITDPPQSPVRTMGEWEEMEAIVVTWTSYRPTLAQIIKYAQEECEVIVICSSEAVAKNQLAGYGVQLNSNVTFIEAPYNTVWIRDYGANPAYLNDVDSLVLIDWRYDRFRPKDDTIPNIVADHLDVPLYTTTSAPTDLVHTGGNFMADGMGTGFSSKLVLESNAPGNIFNATPKTEPEIDQIMSDFMGLGRFIKFETLPYDGIHHIDMHMKLLDEETFIFGEFPEGVSDGPQVEANIQYLLDNYKTPFGNDYNIIRMPQPPCENGFYPPSCSFNAEYRTYINAMIVNTTIMVPIYGISTDSLALELWKQAMPGYKIVGIDCVDVIKAGGAIHCIVKEVGSKDPLWIAHPRITVACADSPVVVTSTIRHRSGIESARVYFTQDTAQGFQSIDMTSNPENEWTASIPAVGEGVRVHYYIEASANSGKTIARPLPAPKGHWVFETIDCITSTSDLEKGGISLQDIYPNPANAITVIPVESDKAVEGRILLFDILGRQVDVIFDGQIPAGESNYFFHARDYVAGAYFVQFKTERQVQVKEVIIK